MPPPRVTCSVAAAFTCYDGISAIEHPGGLVTISPLSVAVSACLLGEPCRYDGSSKPCRAALWLRELPNVTVVPICPEVAGGLPTPRPASEIVGSGPDRRVVDDQGNDRTKAFGIGAQKVLELMRESGCTAAVLKAKSPSCGIGRIYDGSFSGQLVAGNGVAAELLLAAGIPVMDEAQLESLEEREGTGVSALGLARALGEWTGEQ